MTFPDSHFPIRDYRIIRKNRNKNGGGILLHYTALPGNLEIQTVEITLEKVKVLLIGLYKPPFLNENDFHLIII